ncbi:MAG: PEP-CTERM sorting domain-containing protein [Bryobacterales bacterium]|nr:PEP-CTERM sorting domain-containing protein [Bryobacterales bacterium]
MSLLPASGATVYDNGAPLVGQVRDISLFRSADDFVLASNGNIAAVRFWISSTSPIVADPQTNFSGSISYAFYADSSGSLGTLLASGTVSGVTAVPTGSIHSGTNAGMSVIDLDLTSLVALAAGTYWLELHEGPTLSTSDSTNIGWEASANSGGNALQGLAANGLPTSGTLNNLAFQLFDTPFNNTATVPEPGTLGLAALALIAIASTRKKS